MLERARRKRRIRITPLVSTLDVGYLPGRALQISNNRNCLILISNVVLIEFFAGNLDQVCLERTIATPLWHQIGHNAPVFLSHEGFDFAFTLDYHAERHRLHTPGRQTTAHTFPQHPRQAVAHQAVQNPASLLRIHQRHIDVTRVRNRLTHRVGGNFRKCDPVNGDVRRYVNGFDDVPGNSLPFAVRVGRHVNRL